MEWWARRGVWALVCAAVTMSLYYHFLPADWRHNVVAYGVSIGMAAGISCLFVQWQCSSGFFRGNYSKYKRCIYVLLLAVTFLSLNHWLPLQTVQLHLYSRGQGAGEITSLKIDGEEIPGTVWQGNYQAWELEGRNWKMLPGIEGELFWQGGAKKEVRLAMHLAPTSQLQVAFNGREQSFAGGENGIVEEVVFHTPSALPAGGWERGLLYVCDLLSAHILAALLLSLGGQFTRQSQSADRLWRRRTARKQIVWLLVLLLSSVFLAGLFNFTLDPLQYYRKASYTPLWSYEQRYQIPGLIRNQEYDTVFIGASSIEPFYTPQIEAALGGKVLKLSMRGGSLYEQRRALEMALETGKVKRVVWVLDLMAFAPPVERLPGGIWGTFPAYLYDATVWSKYAYLLNESTFKDSFRIAGQLLRMKGQYPSSQDMMDMYYNWKAGVVYSEAAVRKHYDQLNQQLKKNKFADNPQLQLLYSPQSYRYASLIATTEHNVLPLIARYPQVQFDLVWNPYPWPFYALYTQQEAQSMEELAQLKRELQSRVKKQENVVLHDPQQAPLYLNSLGHYRDTLHMDARLAQQLLEDIQKVNFAESR